VHSIKTTNIMHSHKTIYTRCVLAYIILKYQVIAEVKETNCTRAFRMAPSHQQFPNFTFFCLFIFVFN